MNETIKKGVEDIIKYLGSDILLKTSSGQNIRARAIVQPLLYKNKMYIEFPSEQLGRMDDGSYFMIGNESCKNAAADDYVYFKNDCFLIQRCETIYLFDEPIYVWMTLRKTYEGASAI